MNNFEFPEEKPQDNVQENLPVPCESKTPSSDTQDKNETDDRQLPHQSVNSGRVLDDESLKSDEINITSETLKYADEKNFLFKTKQLGNKVLVFCRKFFPSKIDFKIFCCLSIAVASYCIGLLPCNHVDKCYGGLGLKIFLYSAILTFISASVLSLYVFFVILTKKYYMHFMYIIPLYLILFLAFQGTNNVNHGYYNMLVFILALICTMLILGFFYLVYYSFKNKTFILLTIVVVCIVTLLWMIKFSNLILDFNCNSWDKGLNNTYTDNSKEYPCEMKKPPKNTCYLNAFDNVFDFSRWFGYTDCNLKKIREIEFEAFSELLPESMKNRTRFGFPITTMKSFPFMLFYELEDFQYTVYENIIDMDEYESGTNQTLSQLPKPEMQLTFNKKTGRGKVDINVERNETLAKERKKIEEELKNGDETGPYQNVLLIYLDGISRPNFFRKLKKTSNFLETFTKYDPNMTNQQNSIFQFMKYNTIKAETIYNIKPMFYGTPFREKHGTNLVKYYKEKGFVTGHTGTTCGKEIFGIKVFKYSDLVGKLDYNLYDHEGVTLFCDANFLSYSNPLERGVNSYFRRCLYGRPVYDYAMDYTKAFWKAYPDNKKFFRIHLNEGHDPSNSLLSYLDGSLYEFMKSIYEDGFFKDTFVMIMSDHGLHLAGPWKMIDSPDYKIETTIGTLMVMLPNDHKLYETGFYDNLLKNQQTFVTPYDIHDTLVYLAVGNDKSYAEAFSKHGQSLLDNLDHTQRYCESPTLNLWDMAPSSCKCAKRKK